MCVCVCTYAQYCVVSDSSSKSLLVLTRASQASTSCQRSSQSRYWHTHHHRAWQWRLRDGQINEAVPWPLLQHRNHQHTSCDQDVSDVPCHCESAGTTVGLKLDGSIVPIGPELGHYTPRFAITHIQMKQVGTPATWSHNVCVH